MPKLDKKRPGRSTGPTSPNGKKTSSGNSTKHGCRGKQILAGDERQEDFDRLRDGWVAQFEMEGRAGESLLDRVILNDWLLRRTENWHSDVEAGLAELDPMEWTDEQHKKLGLFLRYKTTAERTFYRTFNALKALRKEWVQELLAIENLRANVAKMVEEAAGKTREREKVGKEVAEREKTRAEALFQGQNSPKKMRKIVLLEQWVEVTVEEGKTVTKLYPPNDKLIEEGKAMHPPPELVYRRLTFVNGVPSEYHWATKDEHARRYGGAGIQRMTVDTWLEAIEREKVAGTGHIGRTGVGNLPRPKERGGCDCPSCSHNRKILEQKERGIDRLIVEDLPECEREPEKVE